METFLVFISLCNDLTGDIYNHKYFRGGLLSNHKWVGLVKKHDTLLLDTSISKHVHLLVILYPMIATPKDFR